jgi:hypothetical protein
MNATNRPLGRVVVGIVGLVLLVAGIAAVLVATVPQAADVWHDVAPGALGDLGSSASRADSVRAWTIVLAVAAVVAIVAAALTSSLGGGREGVVIDDDGTAGGVAGAVRVDSTAVQHALSSAIGALPQVGSLAVDVYRVRRRRALRITVRPKRGTSPREIVTAVEAVVADLDALLGVKLPVLLCLARGGAASAQRDRVH